MMKFKKYNLPLLCDHIEGHEVKYLHDEAIDLIREGGRNDIKLLLEWIEHVEKLYPLYQHSFTDTKY